MNLRLNKVFLKHNAIRNIFINKIYIVFNDYEIVYFRTPHYLIDDGTEAVWPQFDLDNQKYLDFSTNMSADC